VLRALLGLACQVESGDKDEVRVRAADLDLRVEPFYKDLGRGNGLLAYAETLC
jgi:hypothetical protein